MTDKKPPLAVGERRKFPRVSVACDVRYSPVDVEDGLQDPGERNPGIMKNISGGGICFVADERHDPGQMLALELGLPGFPSDVISYGRVCWVNEREDGRFDTGVEFWWIGWRDDEAQQAIRDFITGALREPRQGD